jgi:hypothetical protein
MPPNALDLMELAAFKRASERSKSDALIDEGLVGSSVDVSLVGALALKLNMSTTSIGSSICTAATWTCVPATSTSTAIVATSHDDPQAPLIIVVIIIIVSSSSSSTMLWRVCVCAVTSKE